MADRQNRHASKVGAGGPASTMAAAMDLKYRYYEMGLEMFDIDKDPYVFRNHLGQFECRLCLTIHRTITDYIAHTQGRKHADGLRKRAAVERKKLEALEDGAAGPAVPGAGELGGSADATSSKRKRVRIGQPAFSVAKLRDPRSGAPGLQFTLDYPHIEEGLQPRHRFMSAFEQKKEAPDRRFQFLLFAAEPYETVAFKVPNRPIDRAGGRLRTDWDEAARRFQLQFVFAPEDKAKASAGASGTASASAAKQGGASSSSSVPMVAT